MLGYRRARIAHHYSCMSQVERLGWLATARPEINSYSKHDDPPFRLHSNHEGRPAGQPAPSPPGSGSGIRYIPTPNGAGRGGYYNPHISIVDLATS